MTTLNRIAFAVAVAAVALLAACDCRSRCFADCERWIAEGFPIEGTVPTDPYAKKLKWCVDACVWSRCASETPPNSAMAEAEIAFRALPEAEQDAWFAAFGALTESERAAFIEWIEGLTAAEQWDLIHLYMTPAP